MILGNQVEWSLHCMAVLARMPDDVLLSAKLMAEFHGVPKEYLSKSLQALSQAGLVNTHLGPKGGYALAKKPQDISLLEIVEAVEGKQKTFNCQEIRKNNPCLSKEKKKFSSVCSIASAMDHADEAWGDVLRKKKLSHIVEELNNKVPKEDLERANEWFIR
jgi:Rrf2 family protein